MVWKKMDCIRGMSVNQLTKGRIETHSKTGEGAVRKHNSSKEKHEILVDIFDH